MYKPILVMTRKEVGPPERGYIDKLTHEFVNECVSACFLKPRLSLACVRRAQVTQVTQVTHVTQVKYGLSQTPTRSRQASLLTRKVRGLLHP